MIVMRMHIARNLAFSNIINRTSQNPWYGWLGWCISYKNNFPRNNMHDISTGWKGGYLATNTMGKTWPTSKACATNVWWEAASRPHNHWDLQCCSQWITYNSIIWKENDPQQGCKQWGTGQKRIQNYSQLRLSRCLVGKSLERFFLCWVWAAQC